MSYKDEWLVIEANDDIDEMEHREPGEEFLFYRAVANGDVDDVRKNCEQGRFMDTEGVGVLSRDPITNLKYQVKDLRMFSENDVRFLGQFEAAH